MAWRSLELRTLSLLIGLRTGSRVSLANRGGLRDLVRRHANRKILSRDSGETSEPTAIAFPVVCRRVDRPDDPGDSSCDRSVDGGRWGCVRRRLARPRLPSGVARRRTARTTASSCHTDPDGFVRQLLRRPLGAALSFATYSRTPNQYQSRKN